MNSQLQKESIVESPEGFTVRGANMNDLEPAMVLFNRWSRSVIRLPLLRHSFNEFFRRGKRKVGLGVDARTLAGALRLYENAGMHIDQAHDHYEKELREGTEISVQSL